MCSLRGCRQSRRSVKVEIDRKLTEIKQTAAIRVIADNSYVSEHDVFLWGRITVLLVGFRSLPPGITRKENRDL